MAHLLGRLAASAAGHWKRSLAIVAVVLIALGAAATAGGGAFVDSFRTPGTESQQAVDLLTQRFPSQSGDTATMVFATDGNTLKGNAAIAKTKQEIERQPHVTGVAPLQLSANQRVGFLTVQYDQPAQDMQRAPGERLAAVSSIGEQAGLEVSRRGPVVDQAEQLAAPIGELIGLAVAVLVLTLVFRSIASMLLTLIASLIALAGGILLLRFGAAFTDFPSFAPTLGVMLGLGAGIDYALLIVGRYREQLAAGDSVEHSARVANSTAGTSVLAAGAIVVVALARPALHRHPVRRPHGHRLRDRRRQRRGRRRHRAADPDGRLRQAAAPEEPRHGRALEGVRALGDDDHPPPAHRGRRRHDPARRPRPPGPRPASRHAR